MQVQKNILIIILSLFCLFSYFNTLSANFVWDDNSFIVANRCMQSFKYLPQYFTRDFWNIGIENVNSGYYRPLLAASFMLDHAVWGLKPFGYHLTNLILHILSSILLFLFVGALIHDNRIAFFSSLIFSVHPLHTESVSFISGRVDVLPLVFLLLSLILFLKYVSSQRFLFYLCSLSCFFCALLTKEMAVTLPLITLLMDYLFISRRSIKGVIKNIPRYHLGFFAVLGLYLFLRFYFIGKGLFITKLYHASNFFDGNSLFWRLFTLIKILTFYIRLLFFPYGLKADYFFPAANSLFEPVVALGSICLLLLIFTALKNLDRYPFVSFSIGWFFIAVFPVSNILPQGNIFSERFMYIPSVGFCACIAFLFAWLLKMDIKLRTLNWKYSIISIFFLLVIALGSSTIERNNSWNNDFSLWYETAKASRNNPVPHINLASAYYSRGHYEESMEEAKTAIKLYPPFYSEPFVTLGNISAKRGQIDAAIKMYKKALEIRPTAVAYDKLATAYFKKNLYQESIEAELMAIKLNPSLDEAHYNLGLSYSKIGSNDKAVHEYEEFLKANPDFLPVYMSLAQLYYQQGDYQKARELWQGALNISKDYLPAKDALRSLEQ